MDNVIAKTDPEKSKPLADLFAESQTFAKAAPTREELLADGAIEKILAIRRIADRRTRVAKEGELRDKAIISELGGEKGKIGTLVCLALLGDGTLSPENAVGQTMARLQPNGAMPAKPDWQALSKHDGIVWVRAIFMKGESGGLWDSNSESTKYAIAGRVYQQSYASDWNSYNVAARADRVSDYQFRAGGEWFAELYGVYFMGKLPQNHKHYRWFKDTIDQ